ncbi:hypothetical protein BJ170DRAFT_694612 [Xylariales sp. AK1849]|nr:hypothetical protein BJ170DRAFT_694612 [Xylariales sp. AK1849]
MSTTIFTAANVEHMTAAYRNRTILIVSVFYPLALAAVVLRFVGRRISKTNIWWDDRLVIIGLVATGAFCSTLLVDLPTDEEMSGKPIPASLMVKNSKISYVAEIFYYLNQLSLKYSILFFYWRIFSASRYMRVAIYCVGCYVALWFISSFVVTILQCIPVQAIWDPAFADGAHCADLNAFFFGTAIPNILADIFLILLPIPQVLELKITKAQKLFVIFVFLLGGFVIVASIVRLRFLLLVDFDTFPVNWMMDDSVIWTAVENCCGVICVCLPSLRPILHLLPWQSVRQAFQRNTSSINPWNKGSADTCRSKPIFRRSHQRSWSEIDSSGENSLEAGVIRKETEIDISVEMRRPRNK